MASAVDPGDGEAGGWRARGPAYVRIQIQVAAEKPDGILANKPLQPRMIVARPILASNARSTRNVNDRAIGLGTPNRC